MQKYLTVNEYYFVIGDKRDERTEEGRKEGSNSLNLIDSFAPTEFKYQ